MPDMVWRPVPGIDPTRLLVSSEGMVKVRFGNRKELSDAYPGHKTEQGYMRCQAAGKQYWVHRAVAAAFLPLPPSKQHTIDHIDQDKTNNRVENLRWASHSEQMYNRKNGWTKTTKRAREDNDDNADLSGEVWVTMDRLRISNMGRVQTRTPRGYAWHPKHYPKIQQCGYSEVLNRATHLWVLEAFVGPKPSKAHTADHINRIKSDNRASNLRWATPNMQRENQNAYSISGVQRVKVLARPVGTVTWREFDSITDAAKHLTTETGKTFRKGSISEVFSGKLKSHGGWQFKRKS